MRQRALAVSVALWLAGGSPLGAAGDPNFEVRVAPPTNEVSQDGGQVDLRVLLTTKINDVQGWSFGVKLVNDAGVTSKIKHITFGPGLLTTNDGGQVGFSSTSFFAATDAKNKINDCGKPRDASGAKWDGVNCNDPANPLSADALTQGAVIDMGAIVMLPATENLEILGFKVDAAGPQGSFANAVFTDEFGDPATPTVIVYGGASLAPAVQEPAKIGFKGCVAATPFTIDIGPASADTNETATTLVTLNFDKDGTNSAAEIQGWSYGICIKDAAKVVPLNAVVDGTETATIRDGDEPQGNYISVFADGASVGVTHGVVIQFNPLLTIPAQNDWTALVISWKILMTTDDDFTYAVPCSKVLGEPPVESVMVIAGNSIPSSASEGIDPATECCNAAVCNKAGKITKSGIKRATFIGSNVNGDRRLDIADGIYLLSFLFRQGPPPPCMKAADFNDDDVVDLSDAWGMLCWQLQPSSIPDVPRPPGGYPGPAYDPGCITAESPVLTCATPCTP